MNRCHDIINNSSVVSQATVLKLTCLRFSVHAALDEPGGCDKHRRGGVMTYSNRSLLVVTERYNKSLMIFSEITCRGEELFPYCAVFILI